jgi:NADPH-dependent 2,4-dienoyl-CoA reductase/sulfur reductase-like enzyme
MRTVSLTKRVLLLVTGSAGTLTYAYVHGSRTGKTVSWLDNDTAIVKSSKKKSIELKDQRIVVIGGGSAGIGISAMLLNQGAKHVTIIEPSSLHYYQPLWTLVGAGMKPASDSVRPTAAIMPKGALWMQLSAAGILPDENTVLLAGGAKVEYDYLIVCPGIQTNWTAIPGLVEALDDPTSGVISVYGYNRADAASKAISSFEGGRAVFTVPATPVKCPGAVQKIMWLFEDQLANRSDKSLRPKTSIELWSAQETIFGVKKYADLLNVEKEERDVHVNYKQNLVKVDGKRKMATFKNTATGELREVSFDLLHVSPPMSGPDFLKNSSIANEQGFVLVNQNTLQSTKYPNIFALGDVAGTPNSKTVAAITAQAPVVVHNLQQELRGEPLNGVYNGYASCPLIVRQNKCILAEFGYGGKIMETFNWETGKFPYKLIGQDGRPQTYLFAWMKKDLFPFVYWNAWVKGRWYGSNGLIKPDVTKTQP